MPSIIEFFYFHLSPPCRAVWMVLEELGVKYKERIVDVTKNETKTEEYKEVSYRQKVPGIIDGKLKLSESRAIATYLVSKYGALCGKQSLYPPEPEKRAVIDMHLYMDENYAAAILSYVNNGGVLFCGGQTKVENLDKAKDAVAAHEHFLTRHKYIASDNFTLADIFSYVTVSNLTLVDFDFTPYPKVVAWRRTIAGRTYHEKVCAKPLEQFKKLYQQKLRENSTKS